MAGELVWKSLSNARRSQQESAGASREPSVVFVGTEGSGKTILISSFIYKSRPDDLKPTIGVDYKYTRSSPTSGNDLGGKLVTHFWEIGGGQLYSAALPVVLTPSAMAVIVIDLSRVSRRVQRKRSASHTLMRHWYTACHDCTGPALLVVAAYIMCRFCIRAPDRHHRKQIRRHADEGRRPDREDAACDGYALQRHAVLPQQRQQGLTATV